MKKIVLMMLICVCALEAVLPGCADSRRTEDPGTESPGPDLNEGAEPADPGSPADEMQGSDTAENESEEGEEEENMDRKVIVEVNGSRFTATLENNEAVDALVEMMREKPVTIQMSDYAGFEKVGPLGTSLPTSSRQTTTQAGDIVLYQGDQIVIFYGSNSWSYTRLGKIDDLTGWKDALGNGDVTLTFSLA